jgi:hypothetical protein
MALLVNVAVTGNTLLTKFTEKTSKGKVVLPELLDQTKGDHLLHALLGGTLGLAGAASYAAIFPVYTYLTNFLEAAILASFCIMMTTYFGLPDMFNIKRKIVIFIFIMFLVKTAGFILPASIINEPLETAKFEGQSIVNQRSDSRQLRGRDKEDDAAVQQLQSNIQALKQTRNNILASAPGGILTEDQRERLNEIDDAISENQSGELIGEKSSTRSITRSLRRILR